MECGGDKSGDDEAHAFFDPDADEDEDACDVESLGVLVHIGAHQEYGGDDNGDGGGPDPGLQGVQTVFAEVEVFGGGGVAATGVELGEELGDEHHDVDQDGDTHDAGEGADGARANGHVGHAPDDLEDNDNKRGAGAEGGC